MEIEIRTPLSPAEWSEYYDLRYRILREPLGQPRGSERNEGDDTGIHFALFQNRMIEAIARLDYADEAAKIAQVRFVAVNKTLQGKGYGKKIMCATEDAARLRGDRKMILHARDYAVDFYLKLGYTLIGESYLLFGQLQHYLMEKEF